MGAHEIWAAAQLAPGEGIEDGVARIEALIATPPAIDGFGGNLDEAFDAPVAKDAEIAGLREDAVSLRAERDNARADRDALRAEVARLTKIIDDAWGEA